MQEWTRWVLEYQCLVLIETHSLTLQALRKNRWESHTPLLSLDAGPRGLSVGSMLGSVASPALIVRLLLEESEKRKL